MEMVRSCDQVSPEVACPAKRWKCRHNLHRGQWDKTVEPAFSLFLGDTVHDRGFVFLSAHASPHVFRAAALAGANRLLLGRSG
jgi:hypothetical protein